MRTQARLAALLGDIALFDVGLFKPTCVASFGFARQLLLQLGVVVVGAVVVFAPIYARIMAQLRKDSSYRPGVTDFYKGDFGPEVFTRLGKIFHLVDVQWPLLAYKALCAFRCDADGYQASSPSERCRVHNYALGIVCLLVFVVPVPIILEITVRREYELRGGVHAPHVQALFGWCFRDLRPGRHAWRNVKRLRWLLLGAVAALVEGPAIQLCLAILILAAASYCQNTFRPYLGWRLNALESLGCYAAVAACALGVLGIEDNSRYATARAVDGLVILGVLLTASCSLAYAEYVDRQSRKATPRFLAERCRERHTTDIEQRRDKHEPPGPLLPKKNNSCDDLATAIESAAQKVDRFERRLENRARHAARDVLTDGDYEDLPADVLRDIGALQAASDALNARAFYLACHDPERTNDDLERYVQVARRIEYLISDASFTSSFSASPGARFWCETVWNQPVRWAHRHRRANEQALRRWRRDRRDDFHTGGNGRGRRALLISSRCSKTENGLLCLASWYACSASSQTRKNRRRCTHSSRRGTGPRSCTTCSWPRPRSTLTVCSFLEMWCRRVARWNSRR